MGGLDWICDAIQKYRNGVELLSTPLPVPYDEAYLRVFLSEMLDLNEEETCGWLSSFKIRGDEVSDCHYRDMEQIRSGVIKQRIRNDDESFYWTITQSRRMNFVTDAEFIELFEADKINGWGHEHMIRVIFCYLTSLSRRNAIDKIFAELARVQGSGFHLTLTYFWIQMTEFRRAQFSQLGFSVFWDHYREELEDTFLWRQYYSTSILDDPASGSEMRFPDKRQLPTLRQEYLV